MKRFFALLLCLVTALSLIPAASAEDVEIIDIDEVEPITVVAPEDEPAVTGEIAVDAAHFPDAVFRGYVSGNCDTDHDGYLSASEIAAVTEINVYDKGIASMTGVSYFTKLKELYCGSNQISELNVRNLTELESLYCHFNPRLTRLEVEDLSALKNLDVYQNTALKYLDCSNCRLGYLNVEGCTALQTIRCNNNKLAILNLKGCTALSLLWCQSNNLTELDVSGRTELTELYCNNNQLTALNVNGCTALKKLNCEENALTELDVGDCAALEQLACFFNQLTALDVSGCTALQYMFCYFNNLTQLDVSGCTALLSLSCYNNQLTALDVSGCTKLDYLSCDNNKLAALDVSKNTALLTLYCHANGIKTLDIRACPTLLDIYLNGAHSEEETYDKYTLNSNWFTVDKTTTVNAGMTKPTITTQPKSQSVAEGTTAKFTVVATDAASYQWYYRKNSSDTWKKSTTTGAKTATLSVTAESYRSGYQYRCKVSNSAGYKYSSAATLTVLAKPAITTQPKSQSATEGTTVKFTVAATGGSLKYQWYYRTSSTGEWKKSSGTGATTKTLSVEAKSYRSGYQYRCRVSNTKGYKYSSAATLTVVAKPTITTQPGSRTVSAGTTVKFTVKATGGALSYQWYYRTSSSGEWKKCTGTGAATATLTVEAKSFRSGYQYRCRVSNAAGYKYSSTVTLTVK